MNPHGNDGQRAFTARLTPFACGIQVVLSFAAAGLALWTLASMVKKAFLFRPDAGMHPWTFIYYRPTEYDLPNYLALCVFMGLAGLLAYFLNTEKSRRFLLGKAAGVNPFVALFILFVSLALLGAQWWVEGKWRLAVLLAVAVVPFITMYRAPRERTSSWARREAAFFAGAAALVFLLQAAEVGRFFFRPVQLLNELPGVYSETRIKKGDEVAAVVKNDQYLARIGKDELKSVPLFFDIYARLGGKGTVYLMEDDIEFLNEYRFKDFRLSQSYIVELVRANKPGMAAFLMNSREYRQAFSIRRNDVERYLGLIPGMDMETLKQFYLNNAIEYWHWNIGRGQLNHVGHILNPLNEYALGRPVKDIYFQYGFGNTLLFKWVMDLFGGVSFENFYKVNILYLIYYAGFILMLHVLFRDTRYTVAAFLIVPISFYFMGYIFMLMGPGHIPTRHLMDVPVLVLLAAFFRGKRLLPLVLAGALVPVGVFVNAQYGMILLAAFCAALVLYLIENWKADPRSPNALAAGVGTVCLALAAHEIMGGLTNNAYVRYFLHGFFSWPSSTGMVLLTVLYMAVSYAFTAWIRKERDALKYIFVFVFIYAQCILVYYFWNGLLNHVYPAVPFLWLQLMLMLRILSKRASREGTRVGRIVRSAPSMAAALLLVVLPVSMLSYYGEKLRVEKYFQSHTLHAWNFSAARVLTPADPLPVDESVALIHKYSSPGRPGIYILSKYDNILPLLAGRYSRMPVFELCSFLFSSRESSEVVRLLKKDRPAYLFVDADIHAYRFDPWAKIYNSTYMRMERAARMNKYAVLEGIFTSVEGEYRKIEQGRLLAVYRRKT